eukprot:TRINITY_DN29908_c0_g1_i1.p1 TRINITY_DN29908_c0_g1~~TRINITY_DN29908_c0_g1_i1.p1  ORF type:complete len:139 (-),score=28.95 TRINITY_DN29908_c0_g1_i1:182-598(-)
MQPLSPLVEPRPPKQQPDPTTSTITASRNPPKIQPKPPHQVIQALRKALVPYHKERSEAIACALEKSVRRLYCSDREQYKTQMVSVILALKDKESHLALALVDGSVSVRCVAQMSSKQMLEYKPKMMHAHAEARIKFK